MEQKKEISHKEQILWYVGRILERLSESQKKTILTMLKKFYGKLKRED